MEIMQQGTSHIESRWRPHIIPYNSHGMTLPSLQDHLRQQMVQHQQSDQQQEHPTEQQQLQQSDHQLQQLQQLQHKQLIKQRQQQQQHQQQQLDVQCEDSAASRGPAASPRLPKLTRLTPLVTASSSGSPPSTASPGKSGGKDGEEKKKGGEWEQYNAGAAFLGPTLWDKTLSYDSDLKVSLEYMDLDEFLNENGIPAEENVKASVGNCNGSSNENADNPNSSINNSSSSSSNNSSSSNTSSNSRNSNNNSNSLSPEVPSSPENPHMGSGMGVVPQVPSGLSGAAPAAPIIVAPPALSPQDYSGDGYSSSPESPDPLSPSLQVHEPVPGQDFDPRTRCFSEEELKPQPMIKKSRKQFVPHELKDDKYWARRRKNNMAAKRSRDARRLKENQIAMRANFLEKENLALRIQMEKMVTEVDSLRSRLSKYEDVQGLELTSVHETHSGRALLTRPCLH
ncbi:hepatic leukemia factor isoform X3 [Procambarus clarkii]|uniref:hepatic leukemia factor isoform X3 n=1 Tax=Procambarus clarkii TaxID=6728 RepID=UPI001E67699C|nr:hepatic leukemia factor-like isoform X3 [Procambarus clarkii]